VSLLFSLHFFAPLVACDFQTNFSVHGFLRRLLRGVARIGCIIKYGWSYNAVYFYWICLTELRVSQTCLLCTADKIVSVN